MNCLSLPACDAVSIGSQGQVIYLTSNRVTSVCATHSANGATAGPQVGAVSASRTAKGASRRQLPSRYSKNHVRFSGSRVIQSSRKAINLRSNGFHEIAGQTVASSRIDMPETEAGIEPEGSGCKRVELSGLLHFLNGLRCRYRLPESGRGRGPRISPC